MEAGAHAAGDAGATGDAVTTEIPRVEPQSGATSTGAASAGESPASAHAAAQHDPFAEKPELYVGAAFAGGLVLAKLLKRLGR